MERNRQSPTHGPWYAQNHVTNIEEMLKTIVRPLQSCAGIESLHHSIDLTATELQNGSLRSVREVEVSLLSNGKVSTHATASSRDLLTNDSHHAYHRRSIKGISTLLPQSVTALCINLAQIGAIGVMPHIWTWS